MSEEKLIKSVVSFQQYIFDEYKKLNPKELLFRGQSDKDWELKPSIDRKGCSLLKYEPEMVNDMLKERPEEFEGIKDNLNLLAKMQHFGLPTRLLDVTKNLLVALYFACQGNFEKDGEVFIFTKVQKYPYRATIVRIISSCYLSHKLNYISSFLEELVIHKIITEFEKNNSLKYLFPQLGICELFVEPKTFSERQNRQSAAFMLCENERYINNDGVPVYKNNILNYKSWPADDLGYRIIIDGECKDSILWELDKLGINEKFLFPELEHTAKYIKSVYMHKND
ncbi:FRG domain-containing protein [Clostridium sp. WILCCON 0269]|uniref:FRG domain-containing protein n=1 Tax=Candidatus Clostridium eludens TaxID=3381663 RepID=A0ABW8SDV8_9CLOT